MLSSIYVLNIKLSSYEINLEPILNVTYYLIGIHTLHLFEITAAFKFSQNNLCSQDYRNHYCCPHSGLGFTKRLTQICNIFLNFK